MPIIEIERYYAIDINTGLQLLKETIRMRGSEQSVTWTAQRHRRIPPTQRRIQAVLKARPSSGIFSVQVFSVFSSRSVV